MIFQKYNSNNRDRIVICSQSVEDITLLQYNYDHKQIKESLNEKYLNSVLDVAPYNYIVFNDGIECIKLCELSHSDESIFSPFNDDIKILIMNDRILTDEEYSDVRDELVSVIAQNSAKYSLRISNNIQWLSLNDDDFSSSLSEIERQAIIKRNNLSIDRNFMSQYEYINDLGEITINKNVVVENNSRSHTNLNYFANKYRMPVSAIVNVNPSLTVNSDLRINDTIFLPAKTAGGNYTICYTLNKIKKEKKSYEYTYNYSKYKVEKVI